MLTSRKPSVYAELVARVYEAVRESDWTDMLECVARAVRADTLGFAYRLDLAVGRPPVAFGVEAPLVARYAHVHTTDRTWSHALCSKPVGRVWEVLPRRLLERTTAYREWVQPQRLSHVLHVGVSNDPSAALLIGLRRSGNPPGDGRFALLERLVPHLQRASELHRRLGAARALVDAYGAMLEALPIGAVLLDGRAHALQMNRAAELILCDERIGSAKHGRLRLGTREVAAAVERACATGEPTAVPVRHPTGRVLPVVVVPMRDGVGSARAGAAAIALLGDPDRRPRLSSDLLGRLYDLTPAQAAMATLLAEGKSLASSAAALGITIATARDRLKQIFARTRTRRQAELVRLLLTGPAAFYDAGAARVSRECTTDG